MDITNEDVEKFKGIVAPVMQYLKENRDPHTRILVTATKAELLYGTLGTMLSSEYVFTDDTD